MQALVNPGERLDDLLIHNLKIIQHPDEFCFSLDAILLTHFVAAPIQCRVVDLGAGTGVISMLLAAWGASRVTGLELNSRMVDMARRSVRLNRLEDRVDILEADLRDLRGVLPAGESDLVVSNPPYRPVGSGYTNPRDGVAMARHELTATLTDVVAAAQYLVKYRGRFAMVHLPERVTEILMAMNQADLEPKRLQWVYPAPGRKPKFLLVEGIRGARPGVDVLPPLFIYDDKGRYSPEILSYYRKGDR